jgi:hypothetical protein
MYADAQYRSESGGLYGYIPSRFDIDRLRGGRQDSTLGDHANITVHRPIAACRFWLERSVNL